MAVGGPDEGPHALDHVEQRGRVVAGVQDGVDERLRDGGGEGGWDAGVGDILSDQLVPRVYYALQRGKWWRSAIRTRIIMVPFIVLLVNLTTPFVLVLCVLQK